jgi:hypothetical protein
LPNFEPSRQGADLENETPVIKLDQEAARAIKSFLAEKGIQKPIRIDLCFKGCCDPTLELRVDNAVKHDFCLDPAGLQFI